MSHGLIHRHLVVTAYLTDPPMSAESGENFLRKLVSLVDMQILMDATAIFCEDLGNEGVTGTVGLTTSHASFHSWHGAERPFMSFDLYSCRDFNAHQVIRFINENYGCIEADYTLFDRNPGARNKIIDTGTVYFNGAQHLAKIADGAISVEECVEHIDNLISKDR